MTEEERTRSERREERQRRRRRMRKTGLSVRVLLQIIRERARKARGGQQAGSEARPP